MTRNGAPPPDGAADRARLSDDHQTLDDLDQTLSDRDQTLSDRVDRDLLAGRGR